VTGSTTELPPASKAEASEAEETAAAPDGRIERGARTRDAIAEGLISLLEAGVVQPTATQVADQAGVSRRLVFHHFEDMESVLKAAGAIQVRRHWKGLVPVDPTDGTAVRVKATVQTFATLYEAIAPVRRAAARAATNSPTLTEQLQNARRTIRSQLGRTFSSELSVDRDDAEREELLDALEAATSFETWDHLRQQTGRSVQGASNVLERLVIGVVS